MIKHCDISKIFIHLLFSLLGGLWRGFLRVIKRGAPLCFSRIYFLFSTRQHSDSSAESPLTAPGTKSGLQTSCTPSLNDTGVNTPKSWIKGKYIYLFFSSFFFLSKPTSPIYCSNIGSTNGLGLWQDCLFSGKIFSVFCRNNRNNTL